MMRRPVFGGLWRFGRIMRTPRLNLGSVLQRQGAYEAAIAVYEAMVTQGEHSLDACNNLGIIYKELRQFETAQAWFERALVIDPDAVNVHWNQATAWLMADRLCARLGGV